MNNSKNIFKNPSDAASGRTVRPSHSLKRRWSDSFGPPQTSHTLKQSFLSLDTAVAHEGTPSPGGTFAVPQKLRRDESIPLTTTPENKSDSLRRVWNGQLHASPNATSSPNSIRPPLSRATVPRPRDAPHHQYNTRKRPRFNYKFRYSLDPAILGTPSPHEHVTPPSPLFFSNSPQPLPALPPRFSSAEAGAKMLSKAKEETVVRTVTMPRGIAVNSLTRRPSPRSRTSNDPTLSTLSQSQSPDLGELESVRGLRSIGFTEYLEQDERPTFVVDLGDASNFQPGCLNTVFTNSALRGYGGLYDEVTGKAEESRAEVDSTRSFLTFKAWILSAAKRGEAMDVCIPSFHRGAFMWTCATLRKRLRVVSGTFMSSPPSAGASNMQTGALSPMSQGSSRMSTNMLSGPPSSYKPLSDSGPQMDYFGVGAMAAQQASDQAILQSVETSITPNSPRNSNQGRAPVTSPMSTLVSPTGDQDGGFFDWTRLPLSDALPPHIQFARSVDWASTALGPIEMWPADLRQMCNLIMASPHPAAMYWGPDLVAIYNEAYVLLAGQKHPKLMGQSYRDAWVEIWDEVKDVFNSAQQSGKATLKDDDCLFIMRNGFLEETYFSWSIIPMVGGDGSVQGLYNPAFEKTRRKIAERRMLTLREVGEGTASARDIGAFWGAVLSSLEYNEFDTPFVMLYSLTEEVSDMDDASSMTSGSIGGPKQCHLEGSLGVPEGHPIAPQDVDFRTSDKALIPVFREVMWTGKPKLLNSGDLHLPAHLLQGLDWRGFGDPATAVVVCPIHPTTSESTTIAFLAIGVNPRRPFDDDYSLFIQLLSRQLATSLASVVLFEEEIKRGQRAAKLAAQDRIELSEQLALKSQEAFESATRFSRMAEFAPVGMFIAASDGKIVFANETWYDVTKVPRGSESTGEWIEHVSDEDKDRVTEMWKNLVERGQSQSAEIRFKAVPKLDPEQKETWVLFSAYPEKMRHNSSMESIFGCITDITSQKNAEWFQKRKMEEAVELKRQQENFIDITSHEMRNPLSAILQCADEIISSLSKAKPNTKDVGLLELIENNIDAAQTITLCSNHQKRIVDDVLTLSKLDSALLVVTPVDAQPVNVVKKALKMFESELTSADIKMNFEVTKSYRDLGVDWVRFDPSRVLQVLINLTTNAIKFTTTENKRTITVTLSASKVRPSQNRDTIVTYVPTRSKGIEMAKTGDWGDGEDIFLQFAVADSGRGLTHEEKKMLFQRFSQASPRTHVTYGGSGLGLFISRELTELQGGEIGVASESKRGSTFAFYVRARVSSGPPPLTLPGVESSEATAATLLSPPAVSPSTARGSSSSTSANVPKPKLNVLVVEDNLVNQRVLQKQLKNMGCEVHVANHGGEALEKLEASWYWHTPRPDALQLGVVLMDQEMPVMDGLTCTRKIRELEAQGMFTRHVPVIAVTANARGEQIETALAAGMDDVVAKPFRIPELIPKIEELLARTQEP